MELIDREKLIEVIYEVYDERQENDGLILTLWDCLAIIKGQPTVNTWISVEERLPDTEELVLVRTDKGLFLGRLCENGTWDFDEWATTYEYPNEGIIAWMPIPEYTEESKNERE